MDPGSDPDFPDDPGVRILIFQDPDLGIRIQIRFSRSGSLIPDPDPLLKIRILGSESRSGSQDPDLRIRIQIRFLGSGSQDPDPDPVLRIRFSGSGSRDPDLVPLLTSRQLLNAMT